jgi:Mrp family chromosome partitioning ATPase/capsular polysaccharide biosynthesis protein
MKLLRRHALWVVIATIAGIAGAWLLYSAQPHNYLSTAQVDVEPNALLGTPVTPNMATEAQVATSGVIVDRTATALGVSPRSLVGHLSASVSSTATVLSIGCTRPDPSAAQQCAQAAATAYIGFRNLLSESTAQQARDPYHVTLVTSATLLVRPAGPGKKILLPIGAILGLALGLGGIVLRDRFDDRVRDRADLERWLEAPVLAAIPRVRRSDPASVFVNAPRSSAAEAYRYLRSRLRPFIVPVSGGGRIVLVASPHGREGRTCVAANLANALAQAGASVLLVDADLRPEPSRGSASHQSLTRVFGAENRPGLTELLAGSASFDEVSLLVEKPGDTRTPPAARLRFVAAGRTADTLERGSLIAALADMRAAADLVVIDSAPLLAVSDALCLVRTSDLVVMVADVRRTERAAISAALREAQASGMHTVAGVLNREWSAANGRVPSALGFDREPFALLDSHPQVPAAVVTSGQNGQRPARLGATSTRAFGPADAGADDDDPPGSGSAAGR